MDKTSLEFYQWLQVIIYFLNQDEWPEKELGFSKEKAITLIANQLSLDPQDPKFLDKAYLAIDQILIEQKTVPNLPSDSQLKKLVADYEKFLQLAQEKDLKTLFPTLDEQINALYLKYQTDVLKELQKEKTFQRNPLLAKVVSQQLTKKLVSELPATASLQTSQQALPFNRYQETISQRSPVKLAPATSQRIAQITWPQVVKLATIPRRLPPPAAIPARPTAPVTTGQRGEFSPVSLFKKIVLAPIVKPLQLVVKFSPFKIPPVIKKAFIEGLTGNDLQLSISNLIKNGLSLNHPQIIDLEKQKNTLADFETKHPFLTLILRNYHQKNITYPERQILPTQRQPFSSISQQLKSNTAGKFKSLISNLGILAKKLISKPEISIFGGGFFMSLPLLAPALPPPVKLIFFSGGAISTFSGIVQKAPKTINRSIIQFGKFLVNVSSKISTLLSSLTTIAASAPEIAPIGVIGAIIAIAVVGLIAITTAGSSMVPFGEIGGTVTHLGTPIAPRPFDQAGHLAEKVIYTLNQCGITKVTPETWTDTETCLNTSSLQNKQLIIDEFNYSTNVVGNNPKEPQYHGLQCVGFVKGIMAALGKTLDKTDIVGARDYLNPPPPTGYQLFTSGLENVQIGDLVIAQGVTYGHIAIVVNKTNNGVWIAQAWGESNGKLEILENNPIYYNGFLRPI